LGRESVFGVEVEGRLPEDWIVQGALVILKCVNPNTGTTHLAFRSDGRDWHEWEVAGALDCMAQAVKNDFQNSLGSPDDSA
jgi:hypothetical protein